MLCVVKYLALYLWGLLGVLSLQSFGHHRVQTAAGLLPPWLLILSLETTLLFVLQTFASAAQNQHLRKASLTAWCKEQELNLRYFPFHFSFRLYSCPLLSFLPSRSSSHSDVNITSSLNHLTQHNTTNPHICRIVTTLIIKVHSFVYVFTSFCLCLFMSQFLCCSTL